MHENAAAVVSPPPKQQRFVHRIEVRARPEAGDPRSDAIMRSAAALPEHLRPNSVQCAMVYLVAGDLDEAHLQRITEELLADPLAQSAQLLSKAAAVEVSVEETVSIEVHPLPGVTDPAARSVQVAVKAMLGVEVEVRTGERFDLEGLAFQEAHEFVRQVLANPVIHDIHPGSYHPEEFPSAPAQAFETRDVPLCNLDVEALERLSRDAHLFLSTEEMLAIQAHYQRLGREPREIELETLAQTWSEHCVHKTLKATIDYSEVPGGEGPSLIDSAERRPNHVLREDGVVRIGNLLKSTVAAATHQLMADGLEEWCLSVFVDNAGIVRFDESTAVCMKVETHNHPSAIEPYGGAATGIGGCIRDIMGTGLAAKPIAATDVFCVGTPEPQEIPSGCIHPARVLSEVVAGVRDYGNRMGIPTLNGAVWFDDAYIGNPLVYCGCVGQMPSWAIAGDAQQGDRIVALGGRTGRDGIHGATFSSAELTDTHADEFSHAVQIGNAMTEKTTLDAILAARDHSSGCLYTAITDCGAGGFSSAVGEMGSDIGAEVHLHRSPLKYEGLTPTEIWISEAQERMVLAVPEANVELLADICADHGVEWCDLGHFGTPEAVLILNHDGVEVGRLSMEFLHEGVPMPVREARWDPEWAQQQAGGRDPNLEVKVPTGLAEMTLRLLAHPNIASKAWIVRQYDHEVQGNSVIKPFAGPHAGPSDAAVILPVPGSERALAIGNGLATGLARDPYLMSLAAIDECVRNLVCVGADPAQIAILDNFCWPSCDDPRNLGSLVRAAEACFDGAMAYRTPFISGKDSLSNQFSTDDGRTIRVPPTLLISGMGIVPEASRAATMDLKRPGSQLVLVGSTTNRLGGSHFLRVGGEVAAGVDNLPVTDLSQGPAAAKAVHEAIRTGNVLSAHDLSEGGLLVAISEMAFAGGFGAEIDLKDVPVDGEVGPTARAFAETPSRYVLEVEPGNLKAVEAALREHEVAHAVIGTVTDGAALKVNNNGEELAEMNLDALHRAWAEGGHA